MFSSKRSDVKRLPGTGTDTSTFSFRFCDEIRQGGVRRVPSSSQHPSIRFASGPYTAAVVARFTVTKQVNRRPR